jgi:predicted aldo/keto reductase-like oxidoreductase
MEHRTLGRTGLEVGVIGLGTEHLYQNKETMDAVLGMAVDAGVNYVDLLYIDPNGDDARFWDSFGPALRRYRDELVLAVHWGGGPRYDLAYCQRTFADVLASVGNGYAEVAMMTMVDEPDRWGGWVNESLGHLRRYQEQGQVGVIGGSAHNTAMAIKAVNSGLLDVLMFPVNMLGHDDQKNRTLYQACVDRGVGLVAMKPYHGGTLLSVNGSPSGITPAQCLEYVFSLSAIATAVPGPKTAEEYRATLHYLEAAGQEKDYRPLITALHNRLAGQCVYCDHCLPCPEGIAVGGIIWHVDQARGGLTDGLKAGYAGFDVKASECTECGLCVERCPFEVDVIAKMHEATQLFQVAA